MNSFLSCNQNFGIRSVHDTFHLSSKLNLMWPRWCKDLGTCVLPIIPLSWHVEESSRHAVLIGLTGTLQFLLFYRKLTICCPLGQGGGLNGGRAGTTRCTSWKLEDQGHLRQAQCLHPAIYLTCSSFFCHQLVMVKLFVAFEGTVNLSETWFIWCSCHLKSRVH